MDDRLLGPRWLAAHVVVVLAVTVCGLLGWWQLDRAREQHAQSLIPIANAAAEPVALDTLLVPGARLSPGAAGRTVTVSGTYVPAAQVLVPDRELDGRTGFDVVTPLLTDGTAVVVVRGWVPADADGAPPGVPPPAAGEVTVTGRLAAGDPAPPIAALPAGQLGSVHLPSLVNEVPFPLYDAVLTRTTESPTPVEPIAAAAPPELAVEASWPLQNIFYAIEWWVFGLAVVAMWVSGLRRREQTAAAARVSTPAA